MKKKKAMDGLIRGNQEWICNQRTLLLNYHLHASNLDSQIAKVNKFQKENYSKAYHNSTLPGPGYS